jgi:hypothetical protein
MTKEDFVPLEKFGKDHWSTLAYAESVMMECGGFQVGLDPRMRQGRRNYRVMREQCIRPKRTSRVHPDMAMIMDSKAHGTRLKDGIVVEGHDDWHCIQDLAQLGYFRIGVEIANADRVQPGVFLHLSPAGRKVADALRQHKENGGTFSTFTPPA